MSRDPRPDLLEEARKILRENPPELDGPRRTRLRSRVHAATRSTPRVLLRKEMVVLGLIACFGGGWLWFTRASSINPREQRAVSSSRTPTHAEPIFRWIGPPGDIEIHSDDNGTRVRLKHGRALFELPAHPTPRRTAETSHASIDLSKARAIVEVDTEATHIHVMVGRVRLSSPDETETRILEAGTTWSSASESTEPSTLPSVLDPGAMMRQADRLRLHGRHLAAARAYGRIASSAWSGAYREEAYLRGAEMLQAAGRSRDALEQLREARRNLTDGRLEPERSALERALINRIESMIEPGRTGNSLHTHDE